ncbi:MAG: SDR family NAD(P)-dependent oxidoreductase [Gammaproteobacteria bacterium]
MQTRQAVLITGAGSGIGRELARLFAADGALVVAASLEPDELEALRSELRSRGSDVVTIPIDLAQPGSAARLAAACDAQGLEIDTLVNNAGFACFQDVVDEDAGRIASMIALNVTTLTQLSALFGRRMKERRRGAILNVGSTAGMMPSTRMAAYCATKAYVNSFTYALAAELEPFGVTVTCLTPGATATNFARNGGIEAFQGRSILKSLFERGKAGSPVEVARAAIAGLRAGKRQVLVGKGALLASIASRLIRQSAIPGLIRNV